MIDGSIPGLRREVVQTGRRYELFLTKKDQRGVLSSCCHVSVGTRAPLAT